MALETAVGKGAHFTVALPIEGVTAPSVHPAPRPAAAVTGGTILVVEDDPQILRLLQRILARVGYEVTAVSSVGEARARLQASRYTLLVTDGQLPDGTAGDVLTAYREKHATGPAVVCTGFVNDDAVLARVRQDARTVLVHKPFATGALVDLATRLIQDASGSQPSS